MRAVRFGSPTAIGDGNTVSIQASRQSDIFATSPSSETANDRIEFEQTVQAARSVPFHARSPDQADNATATVTIQIVYPMFFIFQILSEADYGTYRFDEECATAVKIVGIIRHIENPRTKRLAAQDYTLDCIRALESHAHPGTVIDLNYGIVTE